MIAEHMKGLQLAENFYQECVQPILAEHFPELPYTVCLIGSGSEILGFDTEMSADHHWGARLMMFLTADDYAQYNQILKTTFSEKLPYEIKGHSTHWSVLEPGETGSQIPLDITSGAVNHRIEIYTLDDFTTQYLDSSTSDELTPLIWLTIPAQKLRTMIAGAVYHDGIGELSTLREKLAYYPHEVWLYLLLAGWRRISQEEHLMGRAGYVGDELGSRLIGARLVHDMMNLCFLMEKQYAPYPKWFGTTFQLLDCAETLTPYLHAACDASTWQEREKALIPAYEYLARMHNALAITDETQTTVKPFHTRPFMVSQSLEIVSALQAKITNPDLKRFAEKAPIGAVEQISTNVDVLGYPEVARKVAVLYPTE